MRLIGISGILCKVNPTEPPHVVRAIPTGKRRRGLKMCRACARDGKERKQPARFRPARVRRGRLLNRECISPPTPQDSKKRILCGWFRLTPPRNKSTYRFYGHFVGVCPNGQLLRVVRCHSVTRIYSPRVCPPLSFGPYLPRQVPLNSLVRHDY